MYQKTIIIGNIGSDVQSKTLSSGSLVCNFSVAVSENYTDKSGQKAQKTEWFNVSSFGKLAEICDKYCAKGKQVMIEGEIKTNKWEDKNGNKRESISLVAKTMKLLGSKKESPSQQSNYNESSGFPQTQYKDTSSDDDFDLPF